ncbi:type II toxin-antitoxin system Phd/YefM family antitoxin [Myceligenerans indicum]|uniref:Antitoxin n=1 Tax=Myceligenerans indicum TaxID=2593663 RepID=A0ABS1LQK2_9MICO|nr:type II toxin-antitoxin system prevent-host-death family antitoxin [Myceligenerans indicum]MBL0888349.1 type II toxin-antitoxin system prevent-host-death family antitoxin [Myceligenerans indicum]
MRTIAARELRNHTAEVLRRVADGDHVTVTQHGTPVAEIGPVTSARPRSLRRAELLKILATVQADPGLRDDLAELAGETTDDIGPIL